MTEPRTLKGAAFLVIAKDRYGALKILRTTQSEPKLNVGERMIRVALEVDSALWTPMPTPGTTILVRAPAYPAPEVLAAEWPQSALTDRPESADDRSEPDHEPHPTYVSPSFGDDDPSRD